MPSNAMSLRRDEANPTVAFPVPTTGAGRTICIGFRRWKAYNLKPLLSSALGNVQFVADVSAALALTPVRGDRLVVWGRAMPAGLPELIEASGCSLLRMEDGFIRSVGLGSDLIPPLSLVLDDQGIYFDPSTPSQLEHLLNTAALTDDELCRARQIREFITQHHLTKYNIEVSAPNVAWQSSGRPIILVPGQVEDDASVQFGSPSIASNLALLQAVRARHPQAFIVYKPHPDVLSGNRKGSHTLRVAAAVADHVERELSIARCIAAADEVHTMTSQAGFDALLRDKRVITYGAPFYAGWGLTEDKADNNPAFVRRTRRRTLDELTAVVLLRYPRYWDPRSGQPTDCESVLHWVRQHRDELEASGRLRDLQHGNWQRLKRKASVLLRATFNKP